MPNPDIMINIRILIKVQGSNRGTVGSIGTSQVSYRFLSFLPLYQKIQIGGLSTLTAPDVDECVNVCVHGARHLGFTTNQNRIKVVIVGEWMDKHTVKVYSAG